MSVNRMLHGKKKIYLALVLSLMLVACCCGCIKVVQKSLSGEELAVGSDSPVPAAAGSQTPPVTYPVTPSSAIITATASPAKQVLVEPAAPILEYDPYKTLHATRINQTGAYAREERIPEFEKTFTMKGDAVGLVVNVTKGPLIIGFDIDPLYDCNDDPESCRGTVMTPVNRPYFTITVRNYDTQEIVARDGYAREYSSEKSDRSVTVYSEGRYHITLEGSYLDVEISIATGSSPLASSSKEPDMWYDEEDW